MSTSSTYRRNLDPDCVLRARKNAPAFLQRMREKKVRRNVRRGLVRLGYFGPPLESETNRLAALALDRQDAESAAA